MLVSAPSRAGLYTGTFDPPTRSHIQIMTDVVRKKGFEKLVVVVNQGGSGKAYRCTAEQRAELVRAALPADVAKHVDVRVEPAIGKNMLFDQLRRGNSYEWVGVIGQDSFGGLPAGVRWSRRWLVIDRNGKSAAGELNVEHMDIGELGSGISSSVARKLLAEGDDASGILCPGTAQRIAQCGYYVTPSPGALTARRQHFEALLAGARAAFAPPFIPQQSPEEHANYIRRASSGLLKQP